MPGATKKAIHGFLLDRHAEARSPAATRSPSTAAPTASSARRLPSRRRTPRSGTPPGRQLQFDWKESLELVDANGEVFESNVLSAVLGYSRVHRFIYSRTRTEDDLLACLLATFVRFGGIPE